MGARPMARLIQDNIKKPLAEELLFGKLVDGGHVTLSLRDGQFHFDTHSFREGAVKEKL
jgi:ATP-dependent Clp protease ATP-binding subunit ClpA